MNSQGKTLRQRLTEIIGENGFILIFIVWIIILALTTTTFLKPQNIFTVLRQAAIVSMVGIGEMLVMLLGGMDVARSALQVGFVWTAPASPGLAPPGPAGKLASFCTVSPAEFGSFRTIARRPPPLGPRPPGVAANWLCFA